MAGKRKKGGEQGGGGGHDAAGGLRWLLTYTDMVTLLLALFIIMWAQSSPDQSKMAAVQEAFSLAFGYAQPSLAATGAASGSKPMVFPNSQEQKDMIKEKLRQYLLELRLDQAVNVHLNERGVLIRIYADKIKFARGSAVIPPLYRKVLDRVALILETTNNAIEVNGYTDDSRGDNWTLSAMRAVNTVRYLERKNIAPERMSATGYGAFEPLVPNSDPVRRWMNRRIDIQVLKGPLLNELVDHDLVNQEFNSTVLPSDDQAAPVQGSDEQPLTPAQGDSPKPLTF
ncbi:MAG: OmpA/MotB family protein [bacterium]